MNEPKKLYRTENGAAMLAGVWYVGVFLNIVRGRLLAFWRSRHPAGKEQTQ